MEITKQNLKSIISEMEEALKSVGEKHGLIIKRGNASFSSSNFSVKFEASVIDESGEVMTKERKALLQFSKILGIPEDSYGKDIKFNKGIGILIGYNSKSSKYPFIIKCKSTGKEYGLMETPVMKQLKENAK